MDWFITFILYSLTLQLPKCFTLKCAPDLVQGIQISWSIKCVFGGLKNSTIYYSNLVSNEVFNALSNGEKIVLYHNNFDNSSFKVRNSVPSYSIIRIMSLIKVIAQFTFSN